MADERNEKFTKERNGHTEIDIIFSPGRLTGTYPSTMGHNGHIKIPRYFTGKNQCSFQIHKDTGEVMLVDESTAKTCYVCYVLRDDEIRDLIHFNAAVMCPAAKSIKLSFGGKGGTHYRWEIKWRMAGPIDLQAWEARRNALGGKRKGQTMTLRSLPPPRRLETYDHHEPLLGHRYLPIEDINVKCRTTLTKCVDAPTGHLVAVKHVWDRIFLGFRLRGETLADITTELSHVSLHHLILKQRANASSLTSWSFSR